MTARASVSKSSATPTVLVVHHDVCVRHAADRLGRELGWRVKTFARTMELHPEVVEPSCLITDRIPDHLDDVLPVIFMPVRTDTSATVRALKAGVVVVLVPPVSDAVLVAAIDEALERSELALGRQATECASVDLVASPGTTAK